jgi:hypothetical protein
MKNNNLPSPNPVMVKIIIKGFTSDTRSQLIGERNRIDRELRNPNKPVLYNEQALVNQRAAIMALLYPVQVLQAV